MDLLSKRYASPFLLVDEYILSCEFDEWVMFLINKNNSEKDERMFWELYLIKDFESESFNDFREKYSQDATSSAGYMSKKDREKIVNKSENILNGFNPNQEEGE